MNEYKGPPLQIWLFVALISSILILSVRYFSWYTVLKDNTIGPADTLILYDKGEPANSEVSRILIFGSSRMASAVEEDTRLREIVADKGIGNVEIKVVATPNAELEHLFADIETFKIIKLYRPHVIIIEEDLLLYEADNLNVGLGVANNMFKKALKDGEARNFKGYDKSEDHWNPKLDSIDFESHRFRFKQRGFRSYPFKGRINYILKSFIDDGTRIIAAQVPFASAIVDYKKSLGLDELTQCKLLANTYGIEYWRFNNPLNFSHFHDYTHLNSSGKSIYTSWLVNNINAISNIDKANIRISKEGKDEIKILAFGSSRLGSGIGSTSRINEGISKCLGGTSVSFALVWAANSKLESFFDDPEVFDLIKTYAPTHIVVEKNLFLTDRRVSRRAGRSDVANDLKRLISRGPSERNYRTLSGKENSWNPKHDSLIYDQSIRYVGDPIRKMPLNESMDSILNALNSRLDLIALEMPFPHKIDSIKHKHNAKQENELMKQLSKTYGVDFILNKSKYPFRLYRDKNHLNNTGQELYTAWMIEELCKQIQKKE